MITFYLNRTAKKASYTIGRLSVEGEVLCDTIEDKVRELVDINHDGDFDDKGEGKVYGETAIPAGTYPLTLSMSNRFNRLLPEIHNVPGFSGVRIHSGNTEKDSHGCLIVGKNDKPGWVSNSRHYEQVVIYKMKEYLDKGEKLQITIV